jgi:hypothetical protein
MEAFEQENFNVLRAIANFYVNTFNGKITPEKFIGSDKLNDWHTGARKECLLLTKLSNSLPPSKSNGYRR